MHLELRHLRYVMAVADEGSFRRAADRLHVSQPPLSRQVQQVESGLGVALFERSKSGARLTPAGQAFVVEARRTLAQVERTVAAARAAQPVERWSVGFTTVFDRSAFPAVMEAFERRHPQVRVSEHRKQSIQLVRDVERGIVDAAFIGLHTETRGLTAIKLREEPTVVALPASHRLASRRRLGLDDLAGEKLFWFERRLNPGYHDHCQAVFDRFGFKPRTQPEPEDHHVLLGLIAAGRGLALMSASLRQVRRQGVVFRSLKAEVPLTMGVVLVHAPGNASELLASFVRLAQAAQRANGPA